jgi:hypothetical protein
VSLAPDAMERFGRLRMILEKLTAVSKLVDQQRHTDEIRVMLTQIGILAIDLTQSGISLDSIDEMVEAWKQEQTELLSSQTPAT